MEAIGLIWGDDDSNALLMSIFRTTFPKKVQVEKS